MLFATYETPLASIAVRLRMSTAVSRVFPDSRPKSGCRKRLSGHLLEHHRARK